MHVVRNPLLNEAQRSIYHIIHAAASVARGATVVKKSNRDDSEGYYPGKNFWLRICFKEKGQDFGKVFNSKPVSFSAINNALL
jgi:hypothetical protein